eukprot:gene721-1138_t
MALLRRFVARAPAAAGARQFTASAALLAGRLHIDSVVEILAESAGSQASIFT